MAPSRKFAQIKMMKKKIIVAVALRTMLFNRISIDITSRLRTKYGRVVDIRWPHLISDEVFACFVLLGVQQKKLHLFLIFVRYDSGAVRRKSELAIRQYITETEPHQKPIKIE